MLRFILSLLGVLAFFLIDAYAQDKPKIKQVPPSPTSPASGTDMFKAYCSPCHGLFARGDGPAAPALKKAPADLTRLSARNNGKYPALKVYNIIEGDPAIPAHGSKEMPVWGEVFRSMSHNEGEIKMRLNNLTRYVESIQTK